MIVENINKIDYELKNLFSTVSILEKSRKGDFYFEIQATKPIEYLGEKIEATIRAEISKQSLNNKIIKWSYYTNPVNENSDIIDRVSSVDKIVEDMNEVVTKRRLDSEYFESLAPIHEIIMESAATEEQKQELEKKLEEILRRFSIENKLVEESKFTEDGTTPEKTLVYHKTGMKMSDKFGLETQIKALGIEYVSFVDDTIKFKF